MTVKGLISCLLTRTAGTPKQHSSEMMVREWDCGSVYWGYQRGTIEKVYAPVIHPTARAEEAAGASLEVFPSRTLAEPLNRN